MTGFQIYLGVTDFGGYFVSIFGFILFPVFVIYGLTYGFQMSEKTMKEIEDRKATILFDDIGLTYIHPIFAITYKIKWNTINDIEYYMREDYNEYVFYLSQKPEIIYQENPWFMARIFPFKNNKDEIYIKNDCRNFNQISIMKAKYLPHLTLKK